MWSHRTRGNWSGGPFQRGTTVYIFLCFRAAKKLYNCLEISFLLHVIIEFQEWEYLTESGGFRKGQSEAKWGKMHFLQIRRLREVY